MLTEKYFTTYLLYKKLEVIKRNLQGTSIKGITKDELLKNKVRFPIQIKEQACIGEFLLNLDNTITLLQRKIDNLNKAKKGLSQKLFPSEQSIKPKIRFSEFNQDWEQCELGKIAKTYSGETPPINNKLYYQGPIPFIRSGEIDKSSTSLNISQNALDSSSAKMVSKGNILYALYGATSGEVTIVDIIAHLPSSHFIIIVFYQ